MNNVRTVSDTKRTFYTLHTRPINTIYRRVVEELMVEMHLLSVNADFSYNSFYGLGVVTTFDRFMQGYEPQRDKELIFNALCQAVEDDPQRYRQDAERLRVLAKSLPAKDLILWLSQSAPIEATSDLQAQLQEIASNPKFKYSRLFAIGLYSLLEIADPQLVKDEKQRIEVLQAVATALHISDDKLQKDLDLYRSNLDKMTQALSVMADILSADRKKRQQQSQDQGTVVTPPSSNEPSQASGRS